MSCWLTFLVFFGCCNNIVLIWGFKTDHAERAALIDAAISEAKEHASQLHIGTSKPENAQRHHAHTLAYPETLAQGKARLLYEDMVHRAERKILGKGRIVSSDEVMVLLTELLRTPGSLLTKEEIAKLYLESGCKDVVPTPVCRPSDKYRTIDGTCNNLNNPMYGAANTPFRRLILPQYEDGISAPRGWMQSTGSRLFAGPFSPPNPSPRIISLDVVQDGFIVDKNYTHILMQWGQFLNHDTDLAVGFPGTCASGCIDTDPLRCAPFPVPLNDNKVLATRADHDIYACLSLGRSIPACDQVEPTKLTQRDQIDGVTAYIDGSQVYSPNATILNTLIRDKSSGKGLLRTGLPVPGTNRPSLPFVNQSDIVACPPPLTPNECYLAGDPRVNQVISLTVMHTIWMREHNRIAKRLSIINPLWDDERLFQEARQIVGAQIQKIAFKDYLPLVLGQLYTELIPTYRGYNNTVYPNTVNAFDAAAFRYGHSQIQPYLSRLGKGYKPLPQGPLNIVDAFFAPSQFEKSGGTDPILRGLLTEPVGLADEFLNRFITNRLFAANATSPGFDLASINIQRGRDHGLPPYLTWKRWALQECGIKSSFKNQLTKIHLLQTYGSLETVDLFVGGLAERPLGGGLVGATFACIFAKTFQALRDGDRFYYENDDRKTGIFTAKQRKEIDKTSLSRVICDNSDIIKIQRNAFLADKIRVPCSFLPNMNLLAWSGLAERNAEEDSLLNWNEIAEVQNLQSDNDKYKSVNHKPTGNHDKVGDDRDYESFSELLSKVFKFVDMQDN